MAERIESVGIINIQTNNAEKNTQSLKARMKEVREEMQRLAASGDRTSEAYQRLAQESGELARVQREVAKDTAEASTTFSNTIGYTAGALAGVSGAVQTATAALSMMGVEMGDDSKLMKTLVAAMSITSGLQAIQNGVEAFKLLRTNILRSTLAQKGFNTAMKANPLGATLAVIMAVVGALALLANAFDKSAERSKALAKQSEETTKSLNKIKDSSDYQYRYAEACGASTDELRKMKKEALEAAIAMARLAYQQALAADREKSTDETRDLRKTTGKALDDAKNELKKFKEDIKIEDARARTEAKKQAEEEVKRQAENAKLAAKTRLDAKKKELEEIDKINKEISNKRLNEEQLELQKLKEDYEAKYNLLKKYNKDMKDLEEAYLLETAEVRAKYQEQREQDEAEALQKRKEKETEIAELEYGKHRLEADTIYMQRKKAIYESGETDISNMLNNLEMQRFFNEKSLLEEQYNYGLLTKEEYEKQLTQIELEESEKRRQIADDERKKKEEITKLQQQNIMELTSGVSSLLGGIADNLKEDTQAYKNLKAAQAIIDTLSAATAAFSGITETTGGWGIAAAIAQAAAVTATGMANVRKIYAVDTNGGTNNTNVSTAAVGTLNRNYTNTRLTDGSGAEIDLSEQLQKGIGSIRVWVSERDITNAQDNAQKVVVRNTF